MVLCSNTIKRGIIMLLNGFFWVNSNYKKLYDTPGFYRTTFLPGKYKIVCRGAGGSGGSNGTAYYSGGIGGTGGAGAKGKLITQEIILTEPKSVEIGIGRNYLSASGLLSSENMGGGAGGSSYVLIGNDIYFAQGGGGGGGGGNAFNSGRGSEGGIGGGGGDFCRFLRNTSGGIRPVSFTAVLEDGQYVLKNDVVGVASVEIPLGTNLQVGDSFSNTIAGFITYTITVTVVSIVEEVVTFSGKLEGNIEADLGLCTVTDLYTQYYNLLVPGQSPNYPSDQHGQNGVAGNTTDFPNLSSGSGGHGGTYAGGNSAAGGGASGGTGGGNKGTQGGYTGGGGGGAGGSEDAGGGQGGRGSHIGSDGTNHFTTPVDTTAENAEYGIIGNYGMGGTTATAGKDGFVLITREA